MLPHHVRLVIEALLDPARVQHYSLEDWDLVVRTARKSRLLGTLAARIEDHEFAKSVPAVVLEHFASERRIAGHRRALVTIELDRVARAVPATVTPIVLLKGAAYLTQALPGAASRTFADVDIMVRRELLNETEQALLRGGWESDTVDEYDQHYYREWSHELPPLRFPEHPMELDLHHNIVNPTGRLRPRTEAFFADATAVPGTRYAVLCPEDQVLHACVHLVQDSDFQGRLREIVDIDWLLGNFQQRAGFSQRLIDRATMHGLTRPLWYALHFRARLLGHEFDSAFAPTIHRWRPYKPIAVLMDVLVTRGLLPRHPDARPESDLDPAWWLLTMRYFWLRFPPLLLARHLLVKTRRALGRQSAQSPG